MWKYNILSFITNDTYQDSATIVEDEEKDEDEKEILLSEPDDINHMLNTLTLAKNTKHYRIVICQRMFGPPRLSLVWRKRKWLFIELGKLNNMTSLILKGTTMGQVIPGEVLASGASCQSLQVLQMDAGLIFDDVSSVCQVAESLQHHPNLREVRLMQFLNHVTPISFVSLLDPLIQALATIQTLERVELSCIASFIPWKHSLISTMAMGSFFESSQQPNKLQFVNFTNLGLEDDQFQVIAENSLGLNGLVLNANDNTQSGLQNLLDRILDTSSTSTAMTNGRSSLARLEVMNNVKMNAETFEVLMRRLKHPTSSLQILHCTYSFTTGIKYRQAIDMYLRLHSLHLGTQYYHPLATPESCIQILENVNDNLDCLYTLLREKPCICNRSMHVASLSSHGLNLPLRQRDNPQLSFSTSFRQWFGRLCVGLYVIWMHKSLAPSRFQMVPNVNVPTAAAPTTPQETHHSMLSSRIHSSGTSSGEAASQSSCSFHHLGNEYTTFPLHHQEGD